MEKTTLFFLVFMASFLIVFAAIHGCGETTQLSLTTTTVTTPVVTTTLSGDVVAPSDLEYRGAFRLPEGPAIEHVGWDWGGSAMAYYPAGDPGGPADGYPGSIFGAGNGQTHYISEITIPIPVSSSSKNLSDLNTATSLREFTNVRSGITSLETLVTNSDVVRSGLAYLPALGSQTSGKLYACWGGHFQEDLQLQPSHMWCDLDLANQQGAWWVLNDQSVTLYGVNDIMFEIPESWANTYVEGRRLATARYRDGGWSGMGPCLFAIAPWESGNPPAAQTVLPATPLIRYASTHDQGYQYGETYKMNDYLHADEWTGGAWLTTGNKSAVIFIGTKGTGTTEAWYGNAYGPTMETEDRGWWATSFEGWVLFYSPTDLAAVAQGTMQPYEIQPYAHLNIDEYLYNVDSSQKEGQSPNQKKYHLGACAYDDDRQLLYIFEDLGDSETERPLVHVFRVN